MSLSDVISKTYLSSVEGNYNNKYSDSVKITINRLQTKLAKRYNSHLWIEKVFCNEIPFSA